MFIDNKYSHWYNSIIANANIRVISDDVYSENHHIVPRGLGGSDSKDNLIRLTAKEHFICHLLLTKMVEGTARASMCYAAWQMTNVSNRERYSPTSRIYEVLRKRLSESYKGRIFSDETKRKIGEKSKGRKPMLGKKHSDDAKKKISESKIGVSTPKSEETRRRMSETWKAISPDRSGDKNGMFGKSHSDETKNRISVANKGNKKSAYPRLQCPHCGKVGISSNIKHWHLDNCKEKLNVNK